MFTGFAFTKIITRTLSVGDYGVWASIGFLTTTLAVASGMFPFWSARFTSRGFKGAMKLGLLLNLIISLPLALIAVLLAPTFASAASTSYTYYAYTSILIIQAYLVGALSPVVSVLRPHYLSYGFVAYELVKVSTVFVLVAILKLGIDGAISTLIIANSIQILFYAFVLRELWGEKTNYQYLGEWAKTLPFALFSIGSTFIASLEAFVIFFSVKTNALAYFTLALSAAGPVAYSSSLATALYPRMLSGGTGRDIGISLKMILMLSIPFTFVLIVLGPSILSLVSTTLYIPASLVLSILAVRSFFYTFNAISEPVIAGTEKLDIEGTIKLGQLLRSRLAKSTLLNYLGYGIYLPTLWFILTTYQMTPLNAALTTAILSVPLYFGIAATKYLLARKSMPFTFPYRSALKYVLIPAVLALLSPLIPQPLRWYNTVALIVGGSAVYFTVLYYIDDEAHYIIHAILLSIRSNKVISGAKAPKDASEEDLALQS